MPNATLSTTRKNLGFNLINRSEKLGTNSHLFTYTVLCDISAYDCLSMNQFLISLHFAILVVEEVYNIPKEVAAIALMF